MTDARIALDEARGPLTDLLGKLSGEEGSAYLGALKRMLRKENPWEVAASEFLIWEAVNLGTGPRTVDDFRKALKDGGFRISDWASDILGKPAFTVAAEKTEVDLVRVTVAELGFKNGAKRSDIYERAKDFGLELCPAEVGPQLRLQYKDQPVGEWLFIGMEPITGSGGDLGVFLVGHGGDGLWLRSRDGHPDSFWDGHYRSVFARRK